MRPQNFPIETLIGRGFAVCCCETVAALSEPGAAFAAASGK
jgi:hypothetical protein